MEEPVESAMGISSVPGTQTITNWPGLNTISWSKTRVFTPGVSWITSAILATVGRRSDMGTPHKVHGKFSFW